ncbi:MAG: hypothetical protein WC799_10405, partial [Desulfobacteraceae bacterium]
HSLVTSNNNYFYLSEAFPKQQGLKHVDKEGNICTWKAFRSLSKTTRIETYPLNLQRLPCMLSEAFPKQQGLKLRD